jgi:hypothetical protein
MANIHGQMAGFIKVISIMIKDKDMDNFMTIMLAYSKDNG